MEDAVNKAAKAPAAADHATENAKVKSHARHPDRITITAEALAHVNAWVAELQARRVTVSRNQLVNWLLCNREPSLAPSELRELEAAFFDEVRFAEWALRELKAAQGRGEPATLAEIVARHRPANKAERKDSQTKAKRSRIETAETLGNAPKDAEISTNDTSALLQKDRNFLDKNGVR